MSEPNFPSTQRTQQEVSWLEGISVKNLPDDSNKKKKKNVGRKCIHLQPWIAENTNKDFIAKSNEWDYQTFTQCVH